MIGTVSFREVSTLQSELASKRTVLGNRAAQLQSLRNGLTVTQNDLSVVHMFMDVERVDRLVVREVSLHRMITAGVVELDRLTHELAEIESQYKQRRKLLDEAMAGKG